jgi:tRNA dimethylallyltransferase
MAFTKRKTTQNAALQKWNPIFVVEKVRKTVRIMNYDIIIVTGPTATGKTHFAVELAARIDGEIISADSRQVFRGMDLGTGKDISEYSTSGKDIKYHLIDILDAGEKYSVYRFQRDFQEAYKGIKSRGKTPILCGGTGLYIESVVRNYQMPDVPENPELRKSLAGKTLSELTEILAQLKTLHNSTDVDTCNRAVRAIEIALYEKEHPETFTQFPELNCLVLGVVFDRDQIRKRITERLQQRIDEGMIDETQRLLDSGVDAEVLISYGLEYKHITWFLQGRISYDEFFAGLNTAIHQFAKRQMTWFRRMERNGTKIHWIDGYLTADEKVEQALRIMNQDSISFR